MIEPYGNGNHVKAADYKPSVLSELLADLIAQYLASDGSYGLYDAKRMITIREQLTDIIGRDIIKAKQAIIRHNLVG